MKKYFSIPFLASALFLASCGGNNNTGSKGTEQGGESANVATEISVPGIENVTLSNTWVVEGNDQMKFDTDLIRVKAGEPVEITFKNVGTLPIESMGHNLVVLQPSVDVPTFGAEAAAAMDSEFIPKSSLSSIVAHTKLLGPGQEDKITFTLEKGVYPYICSFPGHFGMMQGKIVAE